MLHKIPKTLLLAFLLLGFTACNFHTEADMDDRNGKGLSEVTFSADGTKIFAANTLDATVSIINPDTKLVLSTIPVGKKPNGLVLRQ